MLEPLVRYAEQKGLGSDSYFEPREVRWVIVLGQQGDFQGIAPLGTPEDKRWTGKSFPMAPRTPSNELQSGGKSHFLAESATTVLLLPRKSDEPLEEKFRSKHAYFKQLIGEAISAGITSLKPIACFLDRPEEFEKGRTEILNKKRSKPTDILSFDLNGRCVLDQDDWHAFWTEKREMDHGKASVAATVLPCLATGHMAPPVKSHGEIKRVGISSMGARLVANDKDSFKSFGLEQAYNAPVSAVAESRYRAALQDLVNHAIVHVPTNPKKKVEGVKFLYWTREPTSTNPVALVQGGEESAFDFMGGDEKLQEGGLIIALKTIRDGGDKPGVSEGNTFYGCGISANGGRLVIRDWWESSVKEVLANVSKWVEDLAIAKSGGGMLGLPKFGALLHTLTRKGLDELPPQLPVSLMRSALKGLPLSQDVLSLAVRRHKMEISSGRKLPGGKITREPFPQRMTLVKAYLNRTRKAGDPIMTTDLNQDETDRAYRCGRLMAIFEKIQRAALPNVNAGIVQRFYGAASSTPALVMPRLFKLSHHHLSSLPGGLAGYFKKQIEQVTAKELMGTTFPRSLTLEEQGRFALGYYHQRADRSNKTDQPTQTDQGGNDQ